MLNLLFAAVAFLGVLPAEQDFLTGWQAELKGQYADALAAYERVAAQPGDLQPYARVHAANMHARLGNAARAEQVYREVLKTAPEGPWVRMAQLQLGKLLLNMARKEEAITFLRNAVNVDLVPWWMEEHAWTTADAMLTVPSARAEGFAYFRKVAAETNYIKPRVDASKRLLDSPALDDRGAGIAGLLRSNAYTEAGKALVLNTPSVLAARGASLPVQDILTLLAPEQVAGVETKTAVPELEEALGEDWLRLWLAYGVRNLATGPTRPRAVALAKTLAARFPESTEAGDALWWLGQRVVEDDVATALGLYQVLAEDCASHYRADDALFEIAKSFSARGAQEAAEEALTHLGEAFHDSRFRSEALYRAAEIALAEGDGERAKTHFAAAAGTKVGDFYAHRALERLREMGLTSLQTNRNLRVDGFNPILSTFPVEVEAPRPLPSFLESNPRVHRLQFFGRHGIDAGEWEALDLLLQTRKEINPDIYYRVAAEAGFAHTALQVAVARGWGLHEGKPTVERLRLEFPRAYWPQVQALGQETGVDPFLILAVAKQESTFRAGVQSHAGATGVMQLMPTTADWLAQVDSNISPAHVANLKSPENSIRLGAYYLMRMVNRSDRNLIYATASYNAGPGNNDKWRKRFPNFSVDAYIEAIPYEETKNYVKRVLGNYAAYYTLYPEEDHIARATQ